MPIRIEQQHTVQQEEKKINKVPHTADATLFSKFLSKELDSSSQASIVQTDTPHTASPLNPLKKELPLTSELHTLNVQQNSLNTISTQTSMLLDNLEVYGSSLQKGLSSKDAWGMITTIEAQVNSIEKANPENNLGLTAVLDDIKVLTTVEKIKINRGDYT